MVLEACGLGPPATVLALAFDGNYGVALIDMKVEVRTCELYRDDLGKIYDGSSDSSGWGWGVFQAGENLAAYATGKAHGIVQIELRVGDRMERYSIGSKNGWFAWIKLITSSGPDEKPIWDISTVDVRVATSLSGL